MPSPDRPLRLLIVLPSWVGDVVMATPTIRRIRDAMPGIFIGALCRPGNDQLLSGSTLFDELHVFQPHGVMATKKAANKVRPRQYDTALLLTNSFSTALIARLAFIPRRIGYNRDTRGMLLTDPITPPRNPDKSWKLTPIVDYYWNLTSHLLGDDPVDWSIHTPTNCTDLPLAIPRCVFMELGTSDQDRAKAQQVLQAASINPTERYAVLNPGGNNPAKRWPTDRFAALADHLATNHNLLTLINGSPAESDLCDQIIAQAQCTPISLPALGNTLGALKPIIDGAAIMITNDTGPRHIAAALSTPLVTLFGPTDPRWTTIPTTPLPDGSPSESIIVADPTLPASESANDHPQRCAIEHIETARVLEAVDAMLARISA
ncbi:MAG: lipopolysaccharide heptosyltransferase II [Phycisphaerales bacterium]|nr:lipopolysaccharide heptosyltransferase II [Phycisphaerales bacterium]